MNKSEVRFFTEGYADMLLLKSIIKIPENNIQKSNTISQLATTMRKQFKKNYHQTIVGIADYDKGKSLVL